MTGEIWHIVIVDDSPDDRAEARRLLLKGSNRRYVFAEADTGAAGMRALAEWSTAERRCIVLDYNLPDMDAPEFLTAIGGSDGAPGWPVVVFTGAASPETGHRALRAGAHDYLGKESMTPQVMVRTVENACERWAMARDLREQTAAARASEQHFQALAQATSDIVYRMSADWSVMHPLDGRALVPSTETALEGWAWLNQNIPAVEHARVRQAITEAIAHKTLFSLEHRVLRPDGSIGWTASRAAPILDANGTVLEWFGAAADITERKAAEIATRLLNERLELALACSAVVLFQQDLDLRYTWIHNPALGFKASDVIGRHDADLFERVADAEASEALKRDVLRTGVGQQHETIVHRQDVALHYRLHIEPQLNADGNIAGVTCAAIDITDFKQAVEALRVADRRKDEFLAMLAHELRNPLAPLQTGLQVLQLTEDRAVIERTHVMMERQLGQMVRLNDDLLDVSRITSGKVVLRLARIDLQAAIRTAVEAVQSLLDDAQQVLRLDIPAEPIWIHADPTRISQVIINLLANATKYSPDGSAIALGVHTSDGSAVMTVTDPGEGIPQDLLMSIFDMFTQVDATLGRAQGGLGIGLAIVKRLTEMHGGTVSATSAGLGAGSTFTLRLPMLQNVADDVDEPVASRVLANGDARLHVLVVDDNVDAAESLGALMSLYGHETRVAYSGAAALAVASEFKPAVVFLDIGMPGMNGYETARRFRAEERSGCLILVALTGWGAESDRAAAQEAGFDHHFTKPIDMSQIDEVLQHTARRQSSGGTRPEKPSRL